MYYIILPAPLCVSGALSNLHYAQPNFAPWRQQLHAQHDIRAPAANLILSPARQYETPLSLLFIGMENIQMLLRNSCAD